MTEKRGPGRPPKNPPAQEIPVVDYEPILEMIVDNDPTKIKVAGLVFSWQNSDTNARRGWRHWRPVKLDTALGQEVLRQFEVSGSHYTGNNTDSNMLYLGPDTVLSYTEERLQKLADQKDQEKAERQIQTLQADPTVEYNRRQIVIDPRGADKNKS
jgi:hypothetical protein